jgi:inosose dehydratase
MRSRGFAHYFSAAPSPGGRVASGHRGWCEHDKDASGETAVLSQGARPGLAGEHTVSMMRLTGPQFSCRDATSPSGTAHDAGALARFVGTAVFAGFAGVELGVGDQGQVRDSRATHGTIDRSGVELSSFEFVAEWRGGSESERERAEGNRAIEFVSSFPGGRLVLDQSPGADRKDLRERQVSALRCVNELGRRAASAGVSATFHPNSAEGSVFRDEADYDSLVNGLNPAFVALTPDPWQITLGGMDPLDIIHTYRDRVDHVRLNIRFDADAAQLHDGDTERARIVAYLCHTGFTGWFVLDGQRSPVGDVSASTIQSAGRYTRSQLTPLVHEAHHARADELRERPQK